MFKKLFSVFVVSVLIAGPSTLYAELSSKARKAAKLAGSGDVAGAMVIYKELMAKDQAKNSALVKEGREGMVKCSLITEKEALKAKHYEEADKILKEIMSAYKDTALVKEAYAEFVQVRTDAAARLSDAGKFDDCITLLNETKTMVPADTAGFNNIAASRAKTLLAAGSRSMDAKDYEKALGYLIALKKENLAKDDATAAKGLEATAKIGKELLALSENQIKEQKYEAALKNIDIALTAVQEDAFTAQAKYDAGLASRLNNQADKALASYRDVLASFKTSPYAARSAYDTYLIYLDKGGKNEALSSITAASGLAPDNIEYQFLRAQMLDETGSKEESKRIFTKLADVLQDRIQKTYAGKEKLQYMLGKAYMSLENYSEAAIEFDKAIIRDPSFSEARKALAEAQFNDKAFSEASANYEMLIKQSSSDYDSLRDSISKNSSSSQDDAQKLEQLRTLTAYYHFLNGLCFEQLGNFDKAEQECRLGLEGVSTKEAAVTIRRIQKAIADKHNFNNPSAPAPAQQNAAPSSAPAPAAVPPAPTEKK